MTRRYVDVSLPPPLARELTYLLPPQLEPAIRPGSVVLVPVHGRLLTGIVVGDAAELSGVDAAKVKEISQVLDSDTLLDPKLVDLCRWIASYYLAPLGSALGAALPPGIQLASTRLVHLRQTAAAAAGEAVDERVLDELKAESPLKVTTLQRRLGRSGLEGALRRLQRDGRVEIVPFLKAPPVRSERCVRLADGRGAEVALKELPARAHRKAAFLMHMLQVESATRKSLSEQGFSSAVVSDFARVGLVESFDREVLRDPLAHIDPVEEDIPCLSPAQETAVEEIAAAVERAEFFPALLHGVTGSGKTLVYVRAVAKVLERRRSAIVLVPEIALAWQTVRRFKAEFGDKVAVLHSQLSPGERYDTWRQLRRGAQSIVIGARSAIFAPMVDLGIIIVDEEHDGSYKQEDLDGRQALAYNGRDVALVRGRREEALVLLGSATPSLETFQNARTGKYHYISLPQRIDSRPLPKVSVVDMHGEPFQRKRRAIFSRELRQKIHERLDRGEKIVLLQNRRGFSPILLCATCGEAVECKRCRVSLTYHRHEAGEMRCHYCDFRGPIPAACDHCAVADLQFEGIGTQQVEEGLLEQFPGVRVIRMDVDSTATKGSHDELVEAFRRGEADILLGTQMVAKGLDFPEVTLVGVISADTSMHMPDFRAAERSFQLLTQVAGRSGRGSTPGEVVIQTLMSDSPVMQEAANQDFEAFAEREMQIRSEAGFPPFGRLIVFLWRGRDEQAVSRAAAKGTSQLNSAVGGAARVLGPATAPLARLRDQFRWHALLCGTATKVTHGIARAALPSMYRSARDENVALSVNVDPLGMM